MELPQGRFLPGPGPRPWVSDLPVEDPAAVWAWHHARRGETGLWPLLHGWEVFGGAPPGPARTGLDDDLAQAWARHRAWFAEIKDDDAALAGTDLEPPFDDWPGLAPPSRRSADPDEAACAAVRDLPSGAGPVHLVLAPAERSADVLGTAGWTAPTDTGRLDALLRSWEERFGTRVLAAVGARLWLSVAWPPAAIGPARRIALEHFLTGTDLMRRSTPFEEYAASLVGGRLWEFRWD
ncbi:DUF4253 domain-containing protein [Actinomadura parmotrematis]|uniref:DUF4253 domain-containing protein n=1 Tax=Actinomadura parmotrematis TaxID=2864039 RepID=A0ABS7FWX0_9ACTN|nr:DUF4253 domain-containing protein [Actinomadura parmotrematis]MBW8484164.1 DUF4253 domain-containing protein [Actinomadura parmotrematis]